MTPPTNLVTLRPGLTLQAPAAASWARMEAERKDRLDVNSSYRDPAEQQKAYDAYRAYLNGGPWAPLALRPELSWHCKGLAVDTDDDQWVRDHPDHGWRFVVPTEKWHTQYYPELDKHAGEPAGGGAVPLPEPTEDEEDGMPYKYAQYVAGKNDKGQYIRALVSLDAHVFVRFVESGDVQALQFMATYDTGSSKGVTPSMLNALEAEVRRAQPRGDIKVTVQDADADNPLT